MLRCVRLLASVQSDGFWFGGMLTKGLKVASPMGQCRQLWRGAPQKPSPLGKVDCRMAARRMRSLEDGIRAFIATEARDRACGDLIRRSAPPSPEGKAVGCGGRYISRGIGPLLNTATRAAISGGGGRMAGGASPPLQAAIYRPFPVWTGLPFFPTPSRRRIKFYT